MFALAVLQAVAALAAQPPTRFELSNGLRVWIQEDHARPVALVQITYKAGSLNEEPGRTGIAHYVEHMVYRATRHVRNEDVYGYIDRIGGRYTGGTWPEVTRYAETVPRWALESALRVTAERMCCALFDSTEFERERSNVVTEANGFSDMDPLSVMRDAVMSAAFEAHPYRLNSDTWARDNLVLTRDEAFRWYRDHYGPNNAVLAIVGDVSTADARRLVEKHFASLPRAPLDGRITVVEAPQRAEKRITVTAPGVAPQLEIVYHAPAVTHRDFPALVATARLLERRLRGIAGARITVTDSASQYPHVLRVRVAGDSTARPDALLAAIDGAIASLRDSVPAAELVAARQDGADSATSGERTSTGIPPRRSNLTRMADDLTDRDALPWETTVEQRRQARAAAARVTPGEVRSFARRWLHPARRTVGVLRPGPDDAATAWSDDRPLAGARMEIPPLRTAPAVRRRPEPVPREALQPLAATGMVAGRRVLRNGIVARAARVPGATYAVLLRADSGAASPTGGHIDLARLASEAAVARTIATLAREATRGGLPWPLSVAIAGPRAVDDLLALVAGPFGALARGNSLPRSNGPADARRDSAFVVAGETQVSIVARLPGVARDHPDRRALELLNYIVGVPSYGGRLGWALTKSGLTYSAAARTAFGAAAGEISFSTTADTRNAEATVQAIQEVIAGVGDAGVEQWELEEAQGFTLGRLLLYGARRDSPPDVVAGALLDSETTGLELLDPPSFSRAYLAVTLADLNRVARVYYRPDHLGVVSHGALPVRAERIFPAGTFRALFESREEK